MRDEETNKKKKGGVDFRVVPKNKNQSVPSEAVRGHGQSLKRGLCSLFAASPQGFCFLLVPGCI